MKKNKFLVYSVISLGILILLSGCFLLPKYYSGYAVFSDDFNRKLLIETADKVLAENDILLLGKQYKTGTVGKETLSSYSIQKGNRKLLFRFRADGKKIFIQEQECREKYPEDILILLLKEFKKQNISPKKIKIEQYHGAYPVL